MDGWMASQPAMAPMPASSRSPESRELYQEFSWHQMPVFLCSIFKRNHSVWRNHQTTSYYWVQWGVQLKPLFGFIRLLLLCCTRRQISFNNCVPLLLLSRNLYNPLCPFGLRPMFLMLWQLLHHNTCLYRTCVVFLNYTRLFIITKSKHADLIKSYIHNSTKRYNLFIQVLVYIEKYFWLGTISSHIGVRS